MARGIVGFQIEIDRLEGKWKLNQNQPRAAVRKSCEPLRSSTDESLQAIATLMQRQPAEEK